MLERIFQYSPVATPTHAAHTPVRSQLFAKKRFTPYHSPQIANYEQVPIGYFMTMR